MEMIISLSFFFLEKPHNSAAEVDEERGKANSPSLYFFATSACAPDTLQPMTNGPAMGGGQTSEFRFSSGQQRMEHKRRLRLLWENPTQRHTLAEHKDDDRQ